MQKRSVTDMRVWWEAQMIENLEDYRQRHQPCVIEKSPSAPSAMQDMAVLNMLREAIFIVERDEQADSDNSFSIVFANRAMMGLIEAQQNNAKPIIFPAPLSSTVPGKVKQHLQKALTDNWPETTSVTLNLSLDERQHVELVLTPRNTSDGACQVICLIHDVSELTSRARYLERRAVKLSRKANELDTSRRELENQVSTLQTQANSMEMQSRFDTVTSLPNRNHFLERASAEFSRSRRYGHDLSVVVAEILGYEETLALHGENAGNQLLIGIAQICETVSRNGADIIGRIGDNQIAFFLPETGLTGALLFVDRLRSLITETPIDIGKGKVKFGVHTGVDSVQRDDRAFRQCMERAVKFVHSGGTF